MSLVPPLPRFHPSPAWLAAYAHGDLASTSSLLVACHLTFCATCRSAVGTHEEKAGAALADATPAHDLTRDDALARLLARVDAPPLSGNEREPETTAPFVGEVSGVRVPRPLGRWLAAQASTKGSAAAGGTLELPRLAPGLRGLRLRTTSKLRARLLLFRAGFTLPEHGHAAPEHTLVLSGGFTDSGVHFGRGDVSIPHAPQEHAPRVDDDGACLALVINEGPLVGSTLAQRLLLALVDR